MKVQSIKETIYSKWKVFVVGSTALFAAISLGYGIWLYNNHQTVQIVEVLDNTMFRADGQIQLVSVRGDAKLLDVEVFDRYNRQMNFVTEVDAKNYERFSINARSVLSFLIALM